MKRYCDRCGAKLNRKNTAIVTTRQGLREAWRRGRPMLYCTECLSILREGNKEDEDQDTVRS